MQLLASTIYVVGLFTQLQIVMPVPSSIDDGCLLLGCLSCVFCTPELNKNRQEISIWQLKSPLWLVKLIFMLSSLHSAVVNHQKNGLLIAMVFPCCLIWCCVCAKFSNCYRVWTALAASYSHQYSAHAWKHAVVTFYRFRGRNARIEGYLLLLYLLVRHTCACVCTASVRMHVQIIYTPTQLRCNANIIHPWFFSGGCICS